MFTILVNDLQGLRTVSVSFILGIQDDPAINMRDQISSGLHRYRSSADAFILKTLYFRRYRPAW